MFHPVECFFTIYSQDYCRILPSLHSSEHLFPKVQQHVFYSTLRDTSILSGVRYQLAPQFGQDLAFQDLGERRGTAYIPTFRQVDWVRFLRDDGQVFGFPSGRPSASCINPVIYFSYRWRKFDGVLPDAILFGSSRICANKVRFHGKREEGKREECPILMM